MKAGLAHSGWGQGVCIGDYDNDGFEDLFVTYFGKNVLLSQQWRWDVYRCEREGRGGGERKTLEYAAARLSITTATGKLDLFVANYIDLDLATAPVPESGPCLYKG